MDRERYRYTFEHEVALLDVECSLILAEIAVESLHGEAQTRMDARHRLVEERRFCEVAADTTVGRDLNRIFCGFLRREFPPTAFHVERLPALATAPAEGFDRVG